MRRRLCSAVMIALALGLFAWVILQPPTHRDSKFPRIGRTTSGAKEALDFWAAQRAYPDALIPETGYAAAFAHSRASLAAAPDMPTVAPWEEIGPHNIGGRTLAVAFNPQNPTTIWAGSASGGVWRSFTAGVGADAWDRVLTGHPVLGVSSIVFAPGDSTTIYIGTGEVYGYQVAYPGVLDRTTRGSYGIGILKSTDGGATWEKSLDWTYNQRRGVNSLVMHPTDPAIVYAATSEGTYKTTDAGDSWNRVHSVVMAMHIVIDPVDPERLFVACGDLGSPNSGIYRTESGGGNWTLLSGGLPANWDGKAWLDIYDASPNVVYASIANPFAGLGLYRTIDHGDTWQRISALDFAQWQGWYSHWVSVDPGDSSKVLTGGIDVWRSTNGGTSLQRVSYWNHWYFGYTPPGGPEGPPDYVHADNHCVVRHPQDANLVYMGTDGGVFLSADGGQNFMGVNGGYQSTQFYNGFSSSLADPELSMGGFQDNATAIYEGDVGWRRVIGGDGAWTALHPIDTDIMFGSAQNLYLRRSLDGGDSWQGVTNGMGGDAAAFVAPYLISYSAPDILYAGKTKVYKTTNLGSNWFATNGNQNLDGNPVLSLGMAWFDHQVVYAGTGPLYSRMHVYVTTNGGDSWEDRTGSLPDRYPSDIGVDPMDSSTAYLTLSGFGTPHLWRTTDSGLTWEDVSGDLPDVPTSAVVLDPDNPSIVYCGNDLGVYVSINAGVTWSEFQDGMPPAMVFDLSIAYLTRELRVATHGNGAYERPLLDPTTAVGGEAVVAGEGTPAGAAAVRMLPNVPNPFNPSTEVRFVLAERGRVRVTVVDATGRVVATLADGVREAGPQALRFDAGGLASGVYLARIEAGGASAARKIVLAR